MAKAKAIKTLLHTVTVRKTKNEYTKNEYKPNPPDVTGDLIANLKVHLVGYAVEVRDSTHDGSLTVSRTAESPAARIDIRDGYRTGLTITVGFHRYVRHERKRRYPVDTEYLNGDGEGTFRYLANVAGVLEAVEDFVTRAERIAADDAERAAEADENERAVKARLDRLSALLGLPAGPRYVFDRKHSAFALEHGGHGGGGNRLYNLTILFDREHGMKPVTGALIEPYLALFPDAAIKTAGYSDLMFVEIPESVLDRVLDVGRPLKAAGGTN